MRRILVVIEDEKLRQRLQLLLRGSGFEAAGVASMAAAARVLAGEAYGAVVVSATEDVDGLARLIASLRDLQPDLSVLALRDITAVPAPSPAADGVPVPVAASPSTAIQGILGTSPKLKAVLAAVGKVAEFKVTVLVRGESGTGKELIARAVHQASPRAAGPFVAVNCGAIPSGLLEAELFGHDKGAFTGAIRDRAGMMEQASGGTLFLDEVGELSPPMQVNLLRVLQEDRVRRVGGSVDLPIDVRVVAATARDLEAEVAAGRFREDLYFRLNVVSLTLPPLRQRLEDLPPLIDFFIQRARQRVGVNIRTITPEAMRRLSDYPWPGNVRELENAIERAAVMTEGDTIDVAQLPERIVAHGGAPDDGRTNGAAVSGNGPAEGEGDLSLRRASRRLEEDLIRRALAQTGGNRTRAAELLEISHRALLYKIKEYGIGIR